MTTMEGQTLLSNVLLVPTLLLALPAFGRGRGRMS